MLPLSKRLSIMEVVFYAPLRDVLGTVIPAQNIKDGLLTLQEQVTGRERTEDDVLRTTAQAKGALMIWKRDH